MDQWWDEAPTPQRVFCRTLRRKACAGRCATRWKPTDREFGGAKAGTTARNGYHRPERRRPCSCKPEHDRGISAAVSPRGGIREEPVIGPKACRSGSDAIRIATRHGAEALELLNTRRTGVANYAQNYAHPLIDKQKPDG
jgi:hypothetical protein